MLEYDVNSEGTKQQMGCGGWVGGGRAESNWGGDIVVLCSPCTACCTALAVLCFAVFCLACLLCSLCICMLLSSIHMHPHATLCIHLLPLRICMPHFTHIVQNKHRYIQTQTRQSISSICSNTHGTDPTAPKNSAQLHYKSNNDITHKLIKGYAVPYVGRRRRKRRRRQNCH